MKKIIKKVQSFVKAKKLAVCTALATVTCALPAFAAESSQTAVSLSETMSTSLNQAVTDFVSMLGVVLPIGLTVFASTFAVKKGMKFFKNISNN